MKKTHHVKCANAKLENVHVAGAECYSYVHVRPHPPLLSPLQVPRIRYLHVGRKGKTHIGSKSTLKLLAEPSESGALTKALRAVNTELASITAASANPMGLASIPEALAINDPPGTSTNIVTDELILRQYAMYHEQARPEALTRKRFCTGRSCERGT